MKDLTGTRLGQYEIVERLGGGGMAVVYRAVQQPLGREIALKALSSELFQDDGFVKRFEPEAKTLAKLDHPNILPIYDFEVMDGNAFLTMPLIRGGTLRDVLNRGPVDALTAWRYLREIGDGLQHAHDAGIVHRDLKPTNVLIHTDGRAMLADFGLARGAGQPTHLTTIGLAIGTPGYMAPEPPAGGVAVLSRPATTSNGPDTASMRAMPSAPPPPPILHGSPLPTPTAAGASTIRTLELMGVRPARARGRFILNSHFSNFVHVARDVTGDRWPEVAYAAGLVQYIEQDAPHDDQLSSPVESLSRLNEALETIYGPESEDMIRAWGRRATERWLAEGRHGLGGARRFVPGRQRKLAGVVKNFTEAMDNVRGEHTHAWLQVDEHQFWLVNFSNMFALGRIKTVKSCHVWTSSIETILRWAGLANDWYVEEVECGSVTGTFDCAFAIRASETN